MGMIANNQFHRITHRLLLSFKIISVFFLILFFAFVFKRSINAFNFPIKTVRVYGVGHVDHKDVQSTLNLMASSSYFAVDVNKMRQALLGLPWVADVTVRRVWPDEISINIMERQPLASWNKAALLSDTGKVFKPKDVAQVSGLPDLSGPSGKELMVLRYYLQMNEMLLPLAHKITKLRLTPYATWHITLDNGIDLQVGHQQVLTRLSRFVKVYNKIIGEHASDVDYVDLRYTNGMAVKWKKPLKT